MNVRIKDISACVGASLIVLGAGCATVNPSADYHRAAGLVVERTAAASYDPTDEEAIDARVAELLAGGLTVDKAVRVALLNNRGFQSLFQTIGASRADVVQSGLLTNPSLAFSLQFPEGGGRTDIKLGFAQELVDLWQIPVRRKIAEAQLEQTILAVVSRGIEIAADVKTKCYQLLALQRAEVISRENLRLVQRTLDLAQARFDAGEVGQVDVNLARSNLLDVKLELITIERDRRVAETALARVLGLSRHEKPWELREALPVPASISSDDNALTLTAMTERLDARVAALQERVAQNELRREYLAVFPSVQLGTEWEQLEGRTQPGRKVLADTARASVAAGQLTAPDIQSSAQRAMERRMDITSIVGPTMTATLPLWDQNQAKIAKTRAQVLQRQKEYEDLLDSVAQEVQQAAAVVRASRELIRFYQEQGLPQAQTNVAIARKAYEAGEQSILVLIDAEESLIAQRRAYLSVTRDAAVAMAELERAVGGRLPAAATTQPAASRPSADSTGTRNDERW